MKKCNKCLADKELDKFPKTGAVCKECKAATIREYRLNDPNYVEKRKAYRNANKFKINNQKKSSYQRNRGSIIKRQRQYNTINRDYINERQRQYQSATETSNINTWILKCIKHAKFADKRLKRENDIDSEHVNELYIKQSGVCAISGIIMTHNRNDLRALSIDRIDSNLGHTKGNIQLVCSALNLAKREYSNNDILGLLLNIINTYNNSQLPEFDGYNYPIPTSNLPLLKKQQIVNKLQNLSFKRPKYDISTLFNDLRRIDDLRLGDYYDGDVWRSYAPSSLPFAGKKLIWHFHPHLWDVRTLGKPLISEVWGNGKIFDRAAINLVNGNTSISLDRIIRELVFAGAGIPSQIHPGFAKAVLLKYGAKEGMTYYDPFAGWGARMLAARSLKLKYVGVEMSDPTYDGLVDMSNTINYTCDLISDDCFNTNPCGDIMFTSPPFGGEEYIGADHTINYSRLLEHTKDIPIRILHIPEGDRGKIVAREFIPINTRIKPGGKLGTELLAIV